MTTVIVLASLIKLWMAQNEIERWQDCYRNLTNDIALCAREHPDQTSIGYRVCEAEARGRYIGCLDSYK